MERVAEKMEKNENCLTKLLRKLLKQKDETIVKTTKENEELKELLLKQQELLNKLNNENLQLSNELNNLKSNAYIKSNNHDADKINLLEQNKSLKEQLLVSQHHNSMMAKDLNEARLQIKYLTKQLAKYE